MRLNAAGGVVPPRLRLSLVLTLRAPRATGVLADAVREAGNNALSDAGVSFDQVEQASVGYVYGESTSGNRAAYELGMTGIPITNVNNNCSTGSTALFQARQVVAGGLAECAMAIGFEKMQRGSLALGSADRESPTERHMEVCRTVYGQPVPEGMPPAPFLFAVAGMEHMERYGSTAEQFAKVAEKNHRHSVNNPYAQFQKEYTLEEILAAKQIAGPLTMLQCSPTSEGAGAAVLCSEEFVLKHGLQEKAVEIIAQAMTTDTSASFAQSAMDSCGRDMTRRAAEQCYAQSGLGPKDIQVVELHDCFATNELITYEGLGLCGEGEGGALIESGDVTYGTLAVVALACLLSASLLVSRSPPANPEAGSSSIACPVVGGQWVVNPSGGLISKGHPLGATGLAQVL